MKLELKHLAGYLPYGLKYKDIPEGYHKIRILYIETIKWCLDNGKPILRPLSDLTKKIEVNGEKFIFSNFYLSENELKTISRCIEMDLNLLDFISANVCLKLMYCHFDIYGLIDAGLAIDINALDK